MRETFYAHIQNANYQLDPRESWTDKKPYKQTNRQNKTKEMKWNERKGENWNKDNIQHRTSMWKIEKIKRIRSYGCLFVCVFTFSTGSGYQSIFHIYLYRFFIVQTLSMVHFRPVQCLSQQMYKHFRSQKYWNLITIVVRLKCKAKPNSNEKSDIFLTPNKMWILLR